MAATELQSAADEPLWELDGTTSLRSSMASFGGSFVFERCLHCEAVFVGSTLTIRALSLASPI